jgi:hypothetical protein
VIGLLVGLLWAAEARAGTYDVYGCRLPDGTRAPTLGWTPVQFSPAGSTSDSCRSGGHLVAALDASVTQSQLAISGWEFNAPRDTSIAGYTIHRTSRVNATHGSRASLLYHDAPVFDAGARRYAQELCIPFPASCLGWGDERSPLAPVNRYSRSGLQIQRLILTSECYPMTNPPECLPVAPEYPNVRLHASQMSLSDAFPPAFTAPPSGGLLASVVDGRRAVAFAAEDRGGGVATVSLMVDGVLVGEQTADPNANDCRMPYTAPVPCPLVTKGSIEFDTTSIANGVHQLSLAVTDAGGNRTVSAPVAVTVRNPGAANGAHASRFARLAAWFETRSSRHRSAATLRFGQTRAIVGTLVDESGAPISDAVLDISATASRPGSSTRSLGQVATDAAGSFRYLPRSGSSRKVTIGYRAFHLDTAASAIATLNVSVRAGVTLSVRPRRASSRGRITFSGRLRGGPGRAGTQVVIYALGGARSRIPVTTVRANAKGRFHYRYRFRNSAPGVTYRFQATMHSQSSYPYATGNSRPVTVRIR